MEYNICTIIEDKLKEIYELPNESSGYIFKFLSMRYCCYKNVRKVKEKELFKFLLEELNLTVFKNGNGEYLIYKDVEYMLKDVHQELMDNFQFRAEMEGQLEDLREELEEVFKKGYAKAHKYKSSSNYKNHLALERLKLLNKHMGANPLSSEGIEDFETGVNHNPFKRSLEESLLCEVEAKKVEFNTSYITEKILEDYVSENLHLIEEDLKLIKTQFDVPGGTIDILAKDKNGTICIIELKIKEDKSIIWQSIHYPSSIKEIYNVREVRMITVVPKYSKPILEALRLNGNVECLEYAITTEGKEIVSLKVKTVQ